MSTDEPTDRDRRLLDLIVDSLPDGVPPEQHREDIASILEFFERLHGEHGAAFPGWLVRGRRFYLSTPQAEKEAT
jgi:hypothetical protein